MGHHRLWKLAIRQPPATLLLSQHAARLAFRHSRPMRWHSASESSSVTSFRSAIDRHFDRPSTSCLRRATRLQCRRPRRRDHFLRRQEPRGSLAASTPVDDEAKSRFQPPGRRTLRPAYVFVAWPRLGQASTKTSTQQRPRRLPDPASALGDTRRRSEHVFRPELDRARNVRDIPAMVAGLRPCIRSTGLRRMLRRSIARPWSSTHRAAPCIAGAVTARSRQAWRVPAAHAGGYAPRWSAPVARGLGCAGRFEQRPTSSRCPLSSCGGAGRPAISPGSMTRRSRTGRRRSGGASFGVPSGRREQVRACFSAGNQRPVDGPPIMPRTPHSAPWAGACADLQRASGYFALTASCSAERWSQDVVDAMDAQISSDRFGCRRHPAARTARRHRRHAPRPLGLKPRSREDIRLSAFRRPRCRFARSPPTGGKATIFGGVAGIRRWTRVSRWPYRRRNRAQPAWSRSSTRTPIIRGRRRAQ